MKMNGLSNLMALSALLLVAAAPLACGGEDTTGTTEGAGGAGSTSTSTSGMASSSSSSSTAASSSSGGMMCMDDPAPCLAMTMGDACATCACNNCLCQVNDCQADMGCVAIRDCARMYMCSGAACYTAATCMMVIDANGGIGGTSVALAIPLGMCTDMACATECGP